MKYIAGCFCFVVLFASAAIAGEVSIHRIDALGEVEVRFRGEVFAGKDADALLLSAFEESGALGEGLNDDALLGIVAVRVASVRDRWRIASRLFKKYPVEEMSETDIAALSPELRYALTRLRVWSWRNVKNLVGMESDVPAAKVFSVPQRGEIVVREIRNHGDAEANLAVDILAMSNPELMKRSSKALPQEAFGYDPVKTEQRMRELGSQSRIVRFVEGLRLVLEGASGDAEALLLKLSEDDYFSADLSTAGCLLRDGNVSPEAVFYVYRTWKQASGGLLLDDSYYFKVYQSLLIRMKNREAFTAFESRRKRLQMYSQMRDMDFALMFYRNVEALKKDFSEQEISECEKRGKAFGREGYYENEEFEKRFQNSLRERAKALKAKRAVASAGTATKNENEN